MQPADLGNHRRQTFKLVATVFLLLFILVLELLRRKPSTHTSLSSTMNATDVAARVFSPITMSRDWSTLGRLTTIIFATGFGGTLNAYFIISFFIEDELRRIGNVFLAFMGLADLCITAGVLPIAAVVLISGQYDTIPVCRIIQTLTSTSTYLYSLFFALVAGETYARVLHTRIYFVAVDIKRRIIMVVLFVITLGVGLGIIGAYWEMDYDYCTRAHDGEFNFRVTTTVLHGVSGILTLYGLITSSIQIKEYNRVRTRYRRSKQFQQDTELIKLHITSYIMYALAWMPYEIVVYLYPETTDGKFYQFACIGIMRSLFTSIYYGSLHGSFARGYSKIFLYCCCKTSLTTYSPRQRRINDASNAPRAIVPDVRTHILHVSPQRGAASTQETSEL